MEEAVWINKCVTYERPVECRCSSGAVSVGGRISDEWHYAQSVSDGDTLWQLCSVPGYAQQTGVIYGPTKMDKIRNIIGSDAFSALLNENITLPDILNTDANCLHDMTHLSLEILHKIKLAAAEEIIAKKFQTADQIKPWQRISTGCQNMDDILRGGIPINGITEIYGCSGVGKTQLCLQLALESQLNNKQTEVIFISTEDIFPSKRLHQLATAFNTKRNVNMNFEDHIYIEHIADSIQLEKCLINRMPKFLAIKNVGLIVIDSIAGLFRSENENCNYRSRSQEFQRIANALNSLQDQYNVAIVIVNQVTDNAAAGVSEPCLGLSWANHVTCRFCLSRNNDSPVRKFEVIFAPDLAPNCTNILIANDGILNA